MVNATQAQFNNQNAQGQQALTGNAIAQGALGGNRTGVAAANLAGQQQFAQAPVIAGLYSNSYNQGLATANQQFQTNPLAASGAIANYGLSGQSAGLQGAGAQLSAGTLEQQTQQAQDTANQAAYAQQQAYPFQTTQWLAGIDTGVGPGLGSSSSGSTTGPAPNQTGQYLGAALTAASLLSDRRAKEDISKIGTMHDGQPMYRYRYKGQQEWHVGPMAQDVEKTHPHAVQEGVGGAKYVDLKAATEDSVQRASGGGVSATPWGNAPTWIPTIGLGNAAPPKASAPNAPSQSSPSMDFSKLANLGSVFSNPSYGGGSFFGGDAYGGSSSNPLDGLTAADYGAGFNSGGSVRGYADGGAPDDPFGDENRRLAYDLLRQQSGVSAPDTIPGGEAPPTRDPSAVINPDEPYRMPDQAAVEEERLRNPTLTKPMAAEDDGTPGLPSVITAGVSRPPTAGLGEADSSALSYSGAPQMAPSTGNPMGTSVGPTHSADGEGGGLFGWSPNVRSGLLAAGLGMLSSRAPNLGNAVGDGALQGLTAYSSAQQHDEKVASEAQKLAKEAADHAEEMKLKKDTLGENIRHNKSTEENASNKSKFTPNGSVLAADGSVHPLVLDQYSGKSIDSVTGQPPKADDKITQKNEKPVISDDDAKEVAQRYVRTGDRTQLQGLGTSGAARQKVNHFIGVAQKEEGLSDQDLGTRVAEWEGRKAGQRVLGTQEAKMGSAAFEAEGAMKLARGAIEKVPRTSFLPLNKLIQGYQTNTLNPDQAELYARAQAIVNTYSAVMARGANITTDASRGHAEALLNTAGDSATWNRTLDTLQSEINMAKGSPEKMREFYRQQFGGKAVAADAASPGAGGAPPASGGFTAPPGAVARQYNGKTYYYDPTTKQPYPGQ